VGTLPFAALEDAVVTVVQLARAGGR
jgi:hypothetical protein